MTKIIFAIYTIRIYIPLPGFALPPPPPVLPPNLRPLVELENGRLVAADVNEIYRLIITRNQRLFDFMYQYIPPELITTHGRKLLQEGIDSLIDNARLSKEKTLCLNNKPSGNPKHTPLLRDIYFKYLIIL